MTDPRAALADLASDVEYLRSRGVLLVMEEDLAAALAVTVDSWECADKTVEELAADIFAALSGEVVA